LLVPFHGWRITHRNHHLYHNNIHKDKTFSFFTKSEYENANIFVKTLRFTYLILFAFPFYLMIDGQNEGNHFNPFNRNLFKTDDEFIQGLTSNILLLIWVTFLIIKFPIITLLDAYFIPVIIFGMWLVLVTYLHHTNVESIFYENKDWTFLKGAAITYDYSYGSLIDHLHHDIGTHSIHHVFFTKIPHYNLVKATNSVKNHLGSFYKYKDANFFKSLHEVVSNCRWIEKNEKNEYKFSSLS